MSEHEIALHDPRYVGLSGANLFRASCSCGYEVSDPHLVVVERQIHDHRDTELGLFDTAHRPTRTRFPSEWGDCSCGLGYLACWDERKARLDAH